MSTPRIIFAFIVASGASLITEDHLFTTLLKRQEPGTPEYNCHDNCGTAITVSKASGDFCSNEVFLYDYNNCIQCSGPDNVDIWRYYGRSLSAAAAQCDGLLTEPLSGEQEDVGEAKHPDDSEDTSSAASSSAPTSTAEPMSQSPSSSAVEATTTAQPATEAPSSSVGVTTAEATSSSDAVSSAESSAAVSSSSAVASAVSSVYETAPVIPVPTISGSLYPTGNGTHNGTAPTVSAPLTAPTGGAENVQLHNVVALIGAIAVGAAFY